MLGSVEDLRSASLLYTLDWHLLERHDFEMRTLVTDLSNGKTSIGSRWVQSRQRPRSDKPDPQGASLYFLRIAWCLVPNSFLSTSRNETLVTPARGRSALLAPIVVHATGRKRSRSY